PPESKPHIVKKYQSVVGGLLWLSLSTGVDITAAVSLPSGYSHNPSEGHLTSAYHVVKYLKGTPDWGIRYTQPLPSSDSPDSVYDPARCVQGVVAWPTDGVPRITSFDRLDPFTDSNWGPQDASVPKEGEMRQEGEMNSLLGAVVTYLGGPLDWSCTREKRCSRSVCESEVKGMDEGVKMVQGLRHLFGDIGATHLSEATPMLFSDNQGGILWAKSEAITKKMRHINIREVAVRDAVKFNEITIGHIPGPLNPADAFTKEMRNDAHFRDLRACLMSPRQLSEV
ncbi:MAG: Ty1/Copia family ribonuclease HI, partial [Plesiomonas shigelloides]